MDERVRRHAELIVEHSIGLGPDDDVVVRAPAAAEELVVALYGAIGERGARPMLFWRSPRASRAYLRTVDPDHLRTKDHELAAMEAADAVVLVKGARNAAETVGTVVGGVRLERDEEDARLSRPPGSGGVRSSGSPPRPSTPLCRRSTGRGATRRSARTRSSPATTTRW